MKYRTLNELQDYLDEESAWRIKEIVDMKRATTSVSFSQVTTIRAAVPLLYAHWEGFIKKSSVAYLTFVNSQRRTYDELSPCFLVFGVKSKLDLLKNSKRAELNIEVVNFFINNLGARANLKAPNAIDTESNLSSSVFDNIALSLGINTTFYEAYYNLIDKSLLDRRNHIAHGSPLDLDVVSYSKLSDEVLSLMKNYKKDIENAASLGSFLRTPPGAASLSI